MASYYLDQTGDVGHCDEITIGPGQEFELDCWWDFDEHHWQRMAFVPVDEGQVTIVRESFRREVRQDRYGTHVTVYLTTVLRNDWPQVVTVVPTVFVAPSRHRR